MASSLNWILSLQLLFLFIPGLLCFPTGAPSRACGLLTPVHPGTSAQTSSSPYQIQLTGFNHLGSNIGSGRYKAGTTIDGKEFKHGTMLVYCKVCPTQNYMNSSKRFSHK